MSRRTIFLILCLLPALLLPSSAAAAIDYPDFASTAGLTLGGDAKQEGNVLRLTPAEGSKRGSVYSSSQVNPQESFENQFAISMHDSTCCLLPLKPADGMAFVIQSQGLTAGEGLGGSLGYSGITPSVEVEFDIFYNAPEPLTDHVSIMTDGNGSAHLQCANPGPTPPCTSNLTFPLYGAPVYGWVEYDAAAQRLKVWVSATATKPETPLLDYGISLASLGSGAYVGFTAATGAHNAIHDVLSWRQGALGSLNPTTTTPVVTAPPEKKAKKRCGKRKAKGKGKGKGKHKGASSSKKKKKKPKCRRKKGKGKGKTPPR